MDFRFVLFASKYMVRAHSAANVPLISMPCVHQGLVTEWRWGFYWIEVFFFFLQIRLMTDYRHSIVVFIEHLLPLCALRKFRKLTFLCYKKIDKFIRSTVLNVTMYPNSTNGMSLDCCIIECSIYAELPIFN